MKWGSFQAQRHGTSTAHLERVKDIANKLAQTGTIRDPARTKLIETRKAVVASWMKTADVLDAQGEVALAGEVRYFANHLPSVLTGKERICDGNILTLRAFLAHRTLLGDRFRTVVDQRDL